MTVSESPSASVSSSRNTILVSGIVLGQGLGVINRDRCVVDRADDDGQRSGVCGGTVGHGVGDGVCAIEVGSWGVVDSGVIRVNGSGSGS